MSVDVTSQVVHKCFFCNFRGHPRFTASAIWTSLEVKMILEVPFLQCPMEL